MINMEKIEDTVKELLKGDDGHGYDHVERVRGMAIRFAEQENANIEVVELASLLHDVDDYKLFGATHAEGLLNARKILDDNAVDADTQTRVLDIIKSMGYSRYLGGVRPATIEGMIVSDADMCDAIGAQGILRTHAYNLFKGNNFFDKNTPPATEEKTASQYISTKNEHATQHFFDKLLIVNTILMTTAGKKEGAKRQKIMIDFLAELFREEGAESWSERLAKFAS